MSISAQVFASFEEEIFWTTEEIKNLGQTVPFNEIAIIARKHETLENFSKALVDAKIPINYDKGRNILAMPAILEIITICKFIKSIGEYNQKTNEELLPEILGFSFFKIEQAKIWELAQNAYLKRESWLSIMQTSIDPQINFVFRFLMQIARIAKSSSCNQVLDYIIGNSEIPDEITNRPMISPIKNYYFSEKSQLEKLQFLSALKKLYELSKTNSKPIFKLHDLIDHIEILEKNNLKIIDKSTFAIDPNGVNLMTAHSAKGQEFNVVFIVNSTKSEWQTKGKSIKIALANNLPIGREKDDLDDQRRLFFVAVTRAKEHLYFCRSMVNSTGKDLEKTEFLGEIEEKEIKFDDQKRLEILEKSLTPTKPIILDEAKINLLRPNIEQYKLNITGLHNFLDLSKGGPQYFLEKNLLHFPQSKSLQLSLGTALHFAIAKLILDWKKSSTTPSFEDMLQNFDTALSWEKLSEVDFAKALETGTNRLKLFYEQKIHNLSSDSLVEVSFERQQVSLENAIINGQIDRIDFHENTHEMVVVDYKTSKPLTKWNSTDDYLKQRIWKYKTQLIMYKLLVENSMQFGNKYKVNKGVISFLEPKNEKLSEIEYEIPEIETKQMFKLIEVVYQKITNLDFPSVEKYEPNFEGTVQFISDLIGEQYVI